MAPTPFDFTFANGPAVLLALVPALLNIAILGYLAGRAKRNVLTYSFALFVGALVVWQSSETLMRLSASAPTAAFWSKSLALGALLIGPLAVHFALLFTERRKAARSPWVWVLLYGPVLAFEALSRAGLNQEGLVQRAMWGWMPQLPTPLLGTLTGLWVAGLALTTLVLLARHALRLERGQPKRAQALLVAGGFAVPTIQGTVTQVIFPTMLALEPIPVASTFMTAFSLCTLIAFRRHGFLEIPTIEERLQEAQVELQERVKQLAEAQRIAHVGNWVWDIPAGRVLWSDEMYRIYGYEPQSFAVTFERAMERVEPQDKARIEASVADDLARAKSGERPRDEYRIRLPDGRIRLLHGRGRIEVEQGRPVRMLGTVQDMTEQQAAEQADRLAFERLLEIEKLRSLDHFKTQFLNTASHELNTPITPVRLQLHLMGAGKFGALSEEQKHAVGIIDRNMGRLAALVQDLLDVARLQGGALKLQVAAVDLRRVATEAVDAYRAAAAAQELTLDVSGPACVVEADARRLNQVLFNLLSNAMKFTPRGGRIVVNADTVQAGVRVTVTDSGEGLDADQRGRLFQPFSQVHPDPSKRQAGTGLGLYICRGIIEAHGGRIWVESDGPGKGSRFSFEVPREGPPMKAAAVKPA